MEKRPLEEGQHGIFFGLFFGLKVILTSESEGYLKERKKTKEI